MPNRLQKVKDNAVTTKQHDFFTEIPYEDYEWLIERTEKAERYEKVIAFAMKHTEDDDIHEFLNRALQGKENEAPSYRLKMDK